MKEFILLVLRHLARAAEAMFFTTLCRSTCDCERRRCIPVCQASGSPPREPPLPSVSEVDPTVSLPYSMVRRASSETRLLYGAAQRKTDKL